jgi:hypothetical protein
MRLLRRQICWLSPLVLKLFSVLFFLSLPRGLRDEVRLKRHLLLFRRRRLLRSFWWHSSVVCKSAGFRLFPVCRI